ncbi:hypothetical protein EMIHUDRAFT_225245 [Emiliania huxleyi CCMP1516]|uniref:Uncharacterized protein n=2 Tax=Emiliania huxleyi TaxID=2903 RepID=A0A0D3KPI0_EMIH1|nr:hypothetical protein EMIHUDRAFT_225245 [Emiliania huxleyi CCMP1516]EOD37665.1 hypothetical protein EMIHUDRAFT_225245 [Emiliania huxleyi CCMP1516]|eukprot:XP_005790094.1 hypothetical protein EMIHUDRAFT_225245 [Emiliania huxleyi CCMP1516]
MLIVGDIRVRSYATGQQSLGAVNTTASSVPLKHEPRVEGGAAAKRRESWELGLVQRVVGILLDLEKKKEANQGEGMKDGAPTPGQLQGKRWRGDYSRRLTHSHGLWYFTD